MYCSRNGDVDPAEAVTTSPEVAVPGENSAPNGPVSEAALETMPTEELAELQENYAVM